MRSVNKVVLIWNVVRDPESKTAASGHSFTSFVLATNREWHSQDWSSQSLAEFHKVVAWWKLAELCAKFLKKWKFIYIEWYLKTRSWDQDWAKVYRTEVVAQDMIMLNKRGDAEWLDEMDFAAEEFHNSEPTESIVKESPKKEEAPSVEEKKEDEKKSNEVWLDWDHI